jgi:hypothetical protein
MFYQIFGAARRMNDLNVLLWLNDSEYASKLMVAIFHIKLNLHESLFLIKLNYICLNHFDFR